MRSVFYTLSQLVEKNKMFQRNLYFFCSEFHCLIHTVQPELWLGCTRGAGCGWHLVLCHQGAAKHIILVLSHTNTPLTDPGQEWELGVITGGQDPSFSGKHRNSHSQFWQSGPGTPGETLYQGWVQPGKTRSLFSKMRQAAPSGDFGFVLEKPKAEKAGLADLKTHHFKEYYVYFSWLILDYLLTSSFF